MTTTDLHAKLIDIAMAEGVSHQDSCTALSMVLSQVIASYPDPEVANSLAEGIADGLVLAVRYLVEQAEEADI